LGKSYEPVPLLFMADLTADPIWLRAPDDVYHLADGMVSLDSLPLSDDLKRRVRAWAKVNDEKFEEGTWPEGKQWTPELEAEHRRWADEGHVLFNEIKAELGPAYDIRHVAEQTKRKPWLGHG
jgi:hypothetical protein